MEARLAVVRETTAREVKTAEGVKEAVAANSAK